MKLFKKKKPTLDSTTISITIELTEVVNKDKQVLLADAINNTIRNFFEPKKSEIMYI